VQYESRVREPDHFQVLILLSFQAGVLRSSSPHIHSIVCVYGAGNIAYALQRTEKRTGGSLTYVSVETNIVSTET
jgi:hypothetical protein